jgi:signal peptidase I
VIKEPTGPRGAEPKAEALRAELAAQGTALCRVEGGSMLPTLQPGDLYRLEPPGPLRRGQIVAIALGEAVVVHRVVAIGPSFVICRGDNRVACDPPVPVGDVLGHVIEVVPGRRLREGPGTVLWFAARARRRRAAGLARRLGGEARLLAAQARGLPSPYPGRPTAVGVGRVPKGFPARAALVAPEVVSGLLDGSLTPPAGVAHVLPAGVYCSLPTDRRVELLAALRGRDLLVWWFDQGEAGLAERSLAALRRVCRSLGRVCGEPGDAVLDLGTGPSQVRFFTAGEVTEALVGAGWEVVGVEPASGRFRGLSCAWGRAVATLA